MKSESLAALPIYNEPSGDMLLCPVVPSLLDTFHDAVINRSLPMASIVIGIVVATHILTTPGFFKFQDFDDPKYSKH